MENKSHHGLPRASVVRSLPPTAAGQRVSYDLDDMMASEIVIPQNGEKIKWKIK